MVYSFIKETPALLCIWKAPLVSSIDVYADDIVHMINVLLYLLTL